MSEVAVPETTPRAKPGAKPEALSENAQTSVANEAVPTKTAKHVTLQLVEWCARYFQQPYSDTAVRNAMPDGFESRDRAVIPRALSVVGLKSTFVLRDLREIDPIVLPCVLFTKDDKPLLFLRFVQGQKLARFIDLSEGGFEQEMPVRKLRKTLQKEVLFVTADSDLTSRRLDPETQINTSNARHWLWGPVRENWSAMFQILIAALGINIFALAVPIFVMNVYDRVIPNLAYVTLWTLAGGVVIALVLDLILKLIRTNVLETTSRRIDLRIASTLFRQALNIKLLDRPGGAAGIANHVRDFETVRDFFTSTSFIAIIDTLFIGIFVIVLWMIVGPIAVVPLLAVPTVILLAFIAQVPIGASVKKSQQLATKRHTVLVESLMGIETIKSLNSEPVMQREWENAVAASARINGQTRFWSNFAISSTMLIQQGVSVIIIVWGVYLVAEGRITVGGLIASNILAGRILAPLGSISQTLIRAQHAFKSLNAVSEMMKLPVETDNTVHSNLRIAKGTLDLQNITFTYPQAPAPALKDVSIKLAEGEIVALLGRVGSGKSTTGKLVSGLLEPENGIILIDGKELGQYEKSEVRTGVGYLPQDPELFTGTLRENLLLGYTSASDEELNRALYLAGMDHFISENPEGLDQFIGEQGNRLSGGQRQSVGLARLLLRRPKILFLDEPTNAMDNHTETIVISRLSELAREGVSMLISTHRMSLAAIASRLIVIDKGTKVLDGPRDEVIKALSTNAAKPAASKKPQEKS